MIRVDYQQLVTAVLMPLTHDMHCSKALMLGSGVVMLCSIEEVRAVTDDVEMLLVVLL